LEDIMIDLRFPPVRRKGGMCIVRAPILAALLSSSVLLAPPIAGAEPITLTDQYDRTVTLDGPVERLATIPIPAASMAVAVGGTPDPLVAIHPLSKTAILEGVLGRFFPETADIPSDIVGDGFMPNVEALLSASPDLVLQWGHQGNDIVAPIEAAGMKVATLKYGTEEDATTWLRLMGMILGADDRSEQIIDWRERVRAEIEAATASIPQEERPRTLYFLRYLSSLKVAGTGTYNDFYIGLAGGKNAAAEVSGFKDVNAEQIIAWNPEVIFLNGFEEELTPEDVYSNPLFADLDAVKNRRVYKLPIGGYRWDPPNQESPLTWMWASMLLHPDRFEWPLRREIAKSYGMLYGKTPTEADIDSILRADMNGGSASYDRVLR
jgi:iron complex transport system substrate-binding protein